MELSQFLNMHSLPPLGRAEKRAYVAVRVSETEYDLITKLAHHPDARHLFGGHIQNVLRWMINLSAWQLDQSLNKGEIKSISSRLVDELRQQFLEALDIDINNYLGKKGRQLHLLMHNDMAEEALKVYKEMLDFANSLEYPWNKVLMKRIGEDQEIDKFRYAFMKVDSVALKEVEEGEGYKRGSKPR